MTAKMITHDDAQESLDALALDTLAPAERDAVLAHVATCAACRAELESLRETVASLALAADGPALSRQRSAAVRDRLLSRARADRADDGGAGGVLPMAARRPRRSSAMFLLPAAAALVIVAGAAALLARSESRRLRLESGALRAELAERDRMLAQLTGPDVAVVEVTSAGARPPYARMFWDRRSNAWTFVAHNLAAPPQGRTYQLWLVTKQSEKINAGTFVPSPAGDAVVRATYALRRDALAAVAVTDEPAGGVPQPTGTMVISGTPAQR